MKSNKVYKEFFEYTGSKEQNKTDNETKKPGTIMSEAEFDRIMKGI